MKQGRRLLLCSNYPLDVVIYIPYMSRFIKAAPALCQTVFVAQLRVGLRTDHGTNMLGSIWNNKVPFDWLDVHKNGTSSCLSCSTGFYNQLLIKVMFWNSNSKTVSAIFKYVSFYLPDHLFMASFTVGVSHHLLSCYYSKEHILISNGWKVVKTCRLWPKGRKIKAVWLPATVNQYHWTDKKLPQFVLYIVAYVLCQHTQPPCPHTVRLVQSIISKDVCLCPCIQADVP